ncbi:MAG: type II toxin-antitoxin system VapC family toxin [Candidatus Woesearchaeota archaeon]
MSEKIYVDTNVWLDYLLQRTSAYEDFQDYALRILQRTLSCEFVIVVSDIVIYEIKKYIDTDFLKDFSHKIEFVKATKEHKEISKNISIHFPDNLHVAIALQEKCMCIITNDIEMRCLKEHIKIIASRDL